MGPYQDEYKALIIQDHSTSTHILLERIADGKGLECKIVTEWESIGNIPKNVLDNRINLVFYAIEFDRIKTKFIVKGHIFGDLPLGLKPGKYQFEFNRLCICEELPEEMFETNEEVAVSASELFESSQL